MFGRIPGSKKFSSRILVSQGLGKSIPIFPMGSPREATLAGAPGNPNSKIGESFPLSGSKIPTPPAAVEYRGSGPGTPQGRLAFFLQARTKYSDQQWLKVARPSSLPGRGQLLAPGLPSGDQNQSGKIRNQLWGSLGAAPQPVVPNQSGRIESCYGDP